jgi:CheY-like chemotaxis protein
MARILVIDDDASLRRLLRLALERRGYAVVEAANGAAGLAAYAVEPADVVITDMQMPVMDGLQLMMALHRMYPTANIIALSAGQQTLALARPFTQRTFAKPFPLRPLLAAVDDLVAAVAPSEHLPGTLVARQTGLPVAVAVR